MSPRFFLSEALRSIRANFAVSSAAVVTVLIAVFILGAFIPSFLYVQSAVDSQKAKVDVDVYLSDSATVPQTQALERKLDGLKAGGLVQSYRYVSKAEGLQELKKRLKPEVFDELTTNPLPDKYNLIPTDAGQAGTIASELRGTPGVQPKQGISYAEGTTNRLLSVARTVQWAGFALIIILLVAAVLLIGNTIRLSIFARRREVEVMKLVGATNWFIRWPFVIEGIVCGLIGAVLSVILLWGVKVAVVDNWIASTDSALTRDQATSIGFVWLCLILVAAGSAVGALGSGVTLRRFLKV